MRAIAAIMSVGVGIIMAGIAQNDTIWKLALLLTFGIWLTYILDGKERRREHEQIGQAVWDDVTNFVASVERKSEEHHADQE